MKKLFYSACFSLLFISATLAQNAMTVKKNQVYLNNTPILRYEKVTANEMSFYNLQGEEILVYFIKSVVTSTQYDEHYVVINFLKERIKVTCDFSERLSTTFGLDSARHAEKLLNWLYEVKVLNNDGTINREKAEAFQWKYNDEAVGGTVRN
ncbi:MAG: hypothetical protein ACLGH8_09770 [Bacteroidia bacterium]